MDYFENLENLLLACNQEALKFGDAKAWDNQKAQSYRRHTPRGKAFKKLDSLRTKSQFDRFMEQYSRIENCLNG